MDCGFGCQFFFFQAEDGIRGRDVTGVQTCALPILAGATRHTSSSSRPSKTPVVIDGRDDDEVWRVAPAITQFREFQPKEIGRASCRERGWTCAGARLAEQTRRCTCRRACGTGRVDV